MTDPVKAGGADFRRRRERARATRQRVLDAALALFVEHGYVTTTIDSIATRADVSAETVYATFRTKRALLSELVDVSIAGGVDGSPVIEAAWVERMRGEPDARRRAAILARNGRLILERRASVDAVVRGAASADPTIAALREAGKAQRFAGQRALLRIVIGERRLRDGLTLDTAADILYAAGSPESYDLLVRDRGWTGARFEAWYRETIERLLSPA
jgi:TetR/AcrR family transcriptional regulator, regulator of autoinduction and epiphytic fitness